MVIGDTVLSSSIYTSPILVVHAKSQSWILPKSGLVVTLQSLHPQTFCVFYIVKALELSLLLSHLNQNADEPALWNFTAQSSRVSPCSDDPSSYVSLNISKYYDFPTLSDGTITCAGKEFRIHRVVLSAQSKFFSTAFQGKWKVRVMTIERLF